MKPLCKLHLSILASIMAACFTTSAFAHGGHHGGGHNGGHAGGFSGGHGFGHATNGTRLSANLTVPAASTFQAQGEATYKNSTYKGDIQFGVTLPIDGKTLVDPNAASTAVLTADLINASSTVYATCTLDVTDIFWKYAQGTKSVSANYQAIVSSNTVNSATPVIARVGTCVNTGSSNPIDFPQVTSGDTVNVKLDTGSGPVSILTGTFQ